MPTPVFAPELFDAAMFGGAAALFDAAAFDGGMFDLGEGANETLGTELRYWTGTQWQPGRLSRWTGSAWVAARLQRWTGSAWAPT